jgi:hypothetical protein
MGQAKTEVVREKLPQSLFQHKSHMDYPEIEPGYPSLRGGARGSVVR